MVRPKKVGTRADDQGNQKRTNELGVVIPLLETINVQGKDITADALHTQHTLAEYLIDHGAYYHLTVKDNQPTLKADIALLFAQRGAPAASTLDHGHGRIENRRIWTSTALNAHVNFPGVQQVLLIEREVIQKKTGQYSIEHAYCVTNRTPAEKTPAQLLKINRGHWGIEAHHHILDVTYREDACRARKGAGPENLSLLRRFALGIQKAYLATQPTLRSIPDVLRVLIHNMRLVFDLLRMTQNACRAKARR